MNPESHSGNVEYKRKIVSKSEKRLEELSSQMRYRLLEHGQECFYHLGVDDDGSMVGVDDEEYKESLENLQKIARMNDYHVSVLTHKTLENSKKVYEILIRERNEKRYIDICVAIMGSVDAGKSTTLSTLSTGSLDNGRGKARLEVMNYPHEIQTGRTSSVSQKILGFDVKGDIVNYEHDDKFTEKLSWPEIIKHSEKVITFYDMCGHTKYLRTTIKGLTSCYPDFAFVIVAANMGVLPMTREHINICISMKIPICIILTKIDICENRQNILKDTLGDIKKLLKGPGTRKVPYKVKNIDDIIISAKNLYNNSIVPIFPISNVTGVGLDNIKKFLNIIPQRKNNELEEQVKYQINTTFQVKGVGLVIGGHLLSGKIKVGQKLYIGPDDKGEYEYKTIKSIHCKRVPLEEVKGKCYVCLTVKKLNTRIRTGQVILSHNPYSVTEFEVDIIILNGNTTTTIRVGYEPVVHIGNVRQISKITHIKDKKGCNETDNVLRVGDKATVGMRFKIRPEYIKEGERLLMAEGIVKILGVVKKIKLS